MSTTFAVHIISADADGLGDPAVIVTICDTESGEEHPIATYPISDGENATDLLWENGWRTLDDPSQVDTSVDVGYDIVTVEPADYEQIVKHVTLDRKSTRLNSSHVKISYAVFCLKKKQMTASE